RSCTRGIGVAPLTSPPRRASPPPPLHRQLSTTVTPANRSDRPSLLAWNLNTHVVLGIPEDEQLLPVYRAPGVNRAAASAPAAPTSSTATASAAARRTGQRTATTRRLARSPTIASCDPAPSIAVDRMRVREAIATPNPPGGVLASTGEGCGVSSERGARSARGLRPPARLLLSSGEAQ